MSPRVEAGFTSHSGECSLLLLSGGTPRAIDAAQHETKLTCRGTGLLCGCDQSQRAQALLPPPVTDDASQHETTQLENKRICFVVCDHNLRERTRAGECCRLDGSRYDISISALHTIFWVGRGPSTTTRRPMYYVLPTSSWPKTFRATYHFVAK